MESKDLSAYSFDGLMGSLLSHDNWVKKDDVKVEEKIFQVKAKGYEESPNEGSRCRSYEDHGYGRGRGGYHGRSRGRGYGICRSGKDEDRSQFRKECNIIIVVGLVTSKQNVGIKKEMMNKRKARSKAIFFKMLEKRASSSNGFVLCVMVKVKF